MNSTTLDRSILSGVHATYAQLLAKGEVREGQLALALLGQTSERPTHVWSRLSEKCDEVVVMEGERMIGTLPVEAGLLLKALRYQERDLVGDLVKHARAYGEAVRAVDLPGTRVLAEIENDLLARSVMLANLAVWDAKEAAEAVRRDKLLVKVAVWAEMAGLSALMERDAFVVPAGMLADEELALSVLCLGLAGLARVEGESPLTHVLAEAELARRSGQFRREHFSELVEGILDKTAWAEARAEASQYVTDPIAWVGEGSSREERFRRSRAMAHSVLIRAAEQGHRVSQVFPLVESLSVEELTAEVLPLSRWERDLVIVSADSSRELFHKASVAVLAAMRSK